MTASTSTDQTYLVRVSAKQATYLATHEVEAPNVAMAKHFAESMAARDAKVSASDVHVIDVQLKPDLELVCASCGEHQGSEYRGYCCAADNMVEL